MRIVARKTLRDFWESNPDSEQQLKAWYRDAEKSNWKSGHDIKAVYRNASIVKNSRVVFNICGNKYRLIVKFEYKLGIGFIRFVGTHKQYDNIDAEKV